MPDLLFIKTSSLGDVIHHMPAVTEARARRPELRMAWVVESAFAPLARLHPAVDEVIPLAGRDWRRGRALGEIAPFVRALRARHYDMVIDTQGLIKSAIIARFAHGPRHGYDPQSIKEPFAARFYDIRHQVARQQHAISRNRALTGLALGYAPEGEPDYGLNRMRLAEPWAAPYAVLLHATADPGKEWAEMNWRTFAAALSHEIDVVLPYGNIRERQRSERIASGNARARVPTRQPLDGVARLIAGASFVVGVDTGLLHLAAALGVPLVAIFTGSEPGLTGPVGVGPMTVLGANGAPPSVDEVIETATRTKS